MAIKPAQFTPNQATGSGASPRPFGFVRWGVITPVAACLALAAGVFAYEQHARAPREEPAPSPSEAPPTTAPSNVAPPESTTAPGASAMNVMPAAPAPDSTTAPNTAVA